MVVRQHPNHMLLLFGLLVLCGSIMSKQLSLNSDDKLSLATDYSTNSSSILSASSPLVKGILLERFSLGEFLQLLSNVSSPSLIFTTEVNNTDDGGQLTIYQTTEATFQLFTTELLMNWENLSAIMAIVIIRIIYMIYLISLLVLCIIFRKKEPVRRKLVVSLTLLVLCLFSNSRAIVEAIPVRKLIFLQYWNLYLKEKYLLNPFQFFERYSQDGIPYWMYNITYFENSMCYLVTFGIVTLYLCSIILYFIHMTKFMLERIISKKKIFLKDSLDKIKENSVKNIQPIFNSLYAVPYTQGVTIENDPATDATISIQDNKLTTMTHDKSVEIDNTVISQTLTPNDTSLVNTQEGSSTNIFSVSEETDSNLTSYAITDVDEIFLTDIDTLGTEERDEHGLATEGIENFTADTKTLKIIQFFKEKKIIEALFSLTIFILWFVLATILILYWKQSYPFLDMFPIFEKIQGLCNTQTRTTTGSFSLIFGLLFPIVFFLVYSFDIYQSIYEFRKQKERMKRNNKKENLPNFLIYYFIDTDLFLYRLECILLFLFGVIIVTLFLIINVGAERDNSRKIAADLVTLFGIEFLIISIMPGISIFTTIFRTWKENKMFRLDENTDKMTVLNLKKFPPSIDCVDFLITRPIERELFYKYLTSEFSQENLLFMEDIMRFQKIPPQKLRYKITKLREIITLYLIQNTSAFEVNISKKLIDSEIQPYILIEHILHHHSIKMINLPKLIREIPRIDSFPEPLQNNATDRELILNAFKEVNHPDFMRGIITEAYSNLLDSYLRFINSRVWQSHVEKTIQFGTL